VRAVMVARSKRLKYTLNASSYQKLCLSSSNTRRAKATTVRKRTRKNELRNTCERIGTAVYLSIGGLKGESSTTCYLLSSHTDSPHAQILLNLSTIHQQLAALTVRRA